MASVYAKLRKITALYGEALISNREKKRPTVRGFKIAHGELGKQIEAARKKVEALQARRNKMPKRIKVGELTGKPLVRLSVERKQLTNHIKMVAYQAESDLLALLRPHYARADQEGRTFITTVLQSSADIEPEQGKLRITLAPLSSEHRSEAVAAMCETLNKMEICFPGTRLRMGFSVANQSS